MLPIAVDAMGGDRAPDEIVAGARAAAEQGTAVLLVGDPGRLGDTGGLEVLAATEVIEMDEEAGGGVRKKKDSSLVRAAEAVRDGKASAMLSAGNTGATMASALLRMGRLPGVARPAVATALPVIGSTPTVLLDAGANAECNASWLLQFAQMGSVYAAERFGIERPRVGLLSIGEEPTKGTPMVKEANGLLSDAPNINFIGNVEGRDVLTDSVDVVVTDGFTGNVVLKSLEGCARYLMDAVMDAIMSTDETRAAGKALLPVLGGLADKVDPERYGGAMLLGTDGLCVISHGSSSATAIASALAITRDLVEGGMVDKLRKAVDSVEP